MNRNKLSILAVIGTLFLVSLACSWTEGDNPPPQNTAVPQINADGSTAVPPPTSVPAPTPEDSTPEDIPILDGAYNIDITGGGTQISYALDATLEDAAALFQENLEELGWTKVQGADSALGNMGALSRKNETGDIMTISLQYNPNGEFVIIQIAVSRANP